MYEPPGLFLIASNSALVYIKLPFNICILHVLLILLPSFVVHVIITFPSFFGVTNPVFDTVGIFLIQLYQKIWLKYSITN